MRIERSMKRELTTTTATARQGKAVHRMGIRVSFPQFDAKDYRYGEESMGFRRNWRRIDDAVKRILRLKFQMGLFETPLAGTSFCHNGKPGEELLLPLPKKAKILVAGSHADNLGYQCGGWTITWQGLSGNNITDGTTILQAITNTVHPETEVVYELNPSADFVKSSGFSYGILVVGEHPYAESDGDNLNLTIPAPGPSTLTNIWRLWLHREACSDLVQDH
ncbi:hypothetical protein Droror1_Dr00026058 [Drosera rotundifolia]